ncbi:hypothetical protein [Enterococcus faecalis]|nr:hypothetical protein [Enterococcus faecalis]
MLFNFWRISAYFRRSWFCSRRLSGFEPGTKIQSDFCPRLFFLRTRDIPWFVFGCDKEKEQT